MTDAHSRDQRLEGKDQARPVQEPGQFRVRWPAVAALYGAVYVAWIQRGAPTATAAGQVVMNAAFLPLAALSLLLFVRAARHQPPGSPLRRALGLFAASVAATGIGNAIWFVQAVVIGKDPTHGWANIPYFANYALGLAGFLALPRARRTRQEWWKFALDAATVIVGGAITIWCLVVRPAAALYHGRLDVALGVAYPLADLLVLLGITTVLLRPPVTGTQRAFALLVVSQVCGIVADLLYSLAYPLTGYTGVLWTDGLYVINYLLLIWSGECYLRVAPAAAHGAETTTKVDATSVHPVSPLPYLAAGAAIFAVLHEGIIRITSADRALAVAPLLLAVLLLLRQIVAVRQNARLVSERAAQAGEARFRALVEHSSDVIMIVDSKLTVRFVSAAIQTVLGVGAADTVGRPVGGLLHPDDAAAGLAFLENALQCPGLTPSIAWRVRHADGDWRRLETVCTTPAMSPSAPRSRASSADWPSTTPSPVLPTGRCSAIGSSTRWCRASARGPPCR
jgi:PAS domain S-box-containing protein